MLGPRIDLVLDRNAVPEREKCDGSVCFLSLPVPLGFTVAPNGHLPMQHEPWKRASHEIDPENQIQLQLRYARQGGIVSQNDKANFLPTVR